MEMEYENARTTPFDGRSGLPSYAESHTPWAQPPELDESGEAIIYSPEIGARVSTAEAVRERVRLHPRARTREIMAMFELEGNRVSPDLIQRIKKEELGDMA